MTSTLTLLTLALAAQNPTTAPVNASQILSQAIAHYNSAATAAGTITMSQETMGHRVVIQTTLQFERPAKLYIRQDLQAKTGNQSWLVTSDGAFFSYDRPAEGLSPIGNQAKRLVEPVAYEGRSPFSYRDIYKAAASSIRDRSTPLDIIIGDMEDLKFLRAQWATVEYGGKHQVGDEMVHVVQGQWREYGGAPASATYQFLIAENGEIRRYAQRETVAVRAGGGANLEPTVVTTTWDVRVKVDAPTDPALFKLVR
jgi:hypothetical protein